MKGSESQADDPLRLLLEMIALQADVLARYLERIYEEAYLETVRSSGQLRPGMGYVITTHDDGTLSIELGDGAHGRRPSTDFDPVAVRYRKVSGHITVQGRAGRPPRRPSAASGV